MNFSRRIFGEVQWTPPPWLQKIGLRKLIIGIGLTVAVLFLALALIRYLENRPRPPQVVANVVAPGVTPNTEDELNPDPLKIGFTILPDERSLIDTTRSVSRIDLANSTITKGATIEPSIPGTWRWEDENNLVSVSYTHLTLPTKA